MRLRHRRSVHGLTSQQVLSLSDRFQVIGVAAARLSAKVVDHESGRDRTFRVLVHRPVG
jgi:hypothetical protein